MHGLPPVLSSMTSKSLAYASVRYSPLSSTMKCNTTHQQGTHEIINAGKFILSSLSISIYRRMTAEAENKCCEETEQLKQLTHFSPAFQGIISPGSRMNIIMALSDRSVLNSKWLQLHSPCSHTTQWLQHELCAITVWLSPAIKRPKKPHHKIPKPSPAFHISKNVTYFW